MPGKRVIFYALLFASLGLALQWWRLVSLNASYDQGIFLQALWNGLDGHPFASTLSSQLSTNVIHNGELPSVDYQRLSQHFTPLLATWIPFVGLLGIWALPFIQIGMITAAGLILFQLAKQDLKPELAEKMTLSFFCANAIIAPTLGNFTDLCQLPLLVFTLLLGLRTKKAGLVIISALLIPLVREDTGIVLASIGIWISVQNPQKRALGIALIVIGMTWVGVVTNIFMPAFGDDNAKRFMVSNFGQFAPDKERATSIDITRQVLSQPMIFARELASPPKDTLMYILGMGLPLLFVPLVAKDALLMASLPLTGILLAQGSNDPLSINIRYTFLVAPALFAGSIYWWKSRQSLFHSRRLKSIWNGCIALSLIFAIAGNQNRSFSFAIPDSIQPWVYASPIEQWRHGSAARQALSVIPNNASVSANTNLVPWLAQRRVLVRFPHDIGYLDGDKREKDVDWIAVDLNNLAHFAEAFPRDRKMLSKSLKWIENNAFQYPVQSIHDGVVVMARGGVLNEHHQNELKRLIEELTIKTMPPEQRQFAN